MKIIVRLISESVSFAFQALLGNKLRSFLSLLGISIGIFSIISVFTLVDTMEAGIRKEIDKLGSDVLYVSKWSWEFSSEYPWWKFVNRPNPDLEDLEALRQRADYIEAVAFDGGRGVQAAFRDVEMKRVSLQAVSEGWDVVNPLDFSDGRFFTYPEMAFARNVCVIGGTVAKVLFPDGNAIGKRIKVGGNKVVVIGVLQYQGEGSFGFSINRDRSVIVPVNFARRFYSIPKLGGNLVVKPKSGIDQMEVKDQLRGVLRAHRRISPTEEDDFSLNTVSSLQNTVAGIFDIIHLVGLVIGLFSILVGGFSIANIMFVSVKERTNLIGIQKSLGAKNYFILFQFLFESVVLCLVGGLAGLALITMLALLSTYGFGFEIALSVENITIGLTISVIIGLVSGVSPAVMAARLDPVEAIRSN